MSRLVWWMPLLVLASLSSCPVQADIVLINDRVDSQQVTEVRFDVPPSCVITGLGFRAHYDNITTMHCRYSELLPDGTLGEPKEAHLGSEPDHDCEGKVLLPDGWVAVGFGARAAPEWDVTTVRVWGRKLNPDGTLGEMKAFSDGFLPEHSLERAVLVDEPDRVLVGAGLRFHFNDIIGIYGRSQRVVDLDPQAKSRKLEVKAWVLDGLEPAGFEGLQRQLAEFDVDRIDVDLDIADIPSEYQLQALNAVASVADAAGAETYLWVTGASEEWLATLFESVSGLDGLVLDTTNGSGVNSLAAVNSACSALGKSFAVRPAADDYIQREAVRKLPKSAAVILDASCLELAEDMIADRDVYVEVDVARQSTGRGMLPDVRINELAGAAIAGAGAGAKGFVAHINAADSYVFDSSNIIALKAIHSLADNPFQPIDQLWKTLCDARFGDASESARVALQWTASANDLIFDVFGVDFQRYGLRIASVDMAKDNLLSQTTLSDASAHGQSVRELLAPTEKLRKAASSEKETVRWVLRQAVAATDSAIEKSGSLESRLLRIELERMRQAAEFWDAATEAYLRAQVHWVDISPETRHYAEEALSVLQNAASSAEASVIPDGVGGFVYSVRRHLDKALEEGPMALAFKNVRKLADSGKDDEAVLALVDILNDPVFAPHMSKQNVQFAELLGSLSSLGTPTDTVHVRRHGDGSWKLEKMGGKWCWVMGEGAPCMYMDVPGDPIDPPGDFVLTFDYFDVGNGKLYFHYDSAYEKDKQYHPVEPIQLQNTGTWKTGSFRMTNAVFSGGQNNDSDMRFVCGQGTGIRNVSLKRAN